MRCSGTWQCGYALLNTLKSLKCGFQSGIAWSVLSKWSGISYHFSKWAVEAVWTVSGVTWVVLESRTVSRLLPAWCFRPARVCSTALIMRPVLPFSRCCSSHLVRLFHCCLKSVRFLPCSKRFIALISVSQSSLVKIFAVHQSGPLFVMLRICSTLPVSSSNPVALVTRSSNSASTYCTNSACVLHRV